MSENDISVVIPTLRRPALLSRALQSVFDQTFPPSEVIVVVDGTDPETRAILAHHAHPRLKVLQNERSLSAAGARNAGVAAAAGTWIAFLDDDDQWYPRKLELQLQFALERHAEFVSCLSSVVAPETTYCWPTTIYDPADPLDAYLFDRPTLFAGAAFLQTSSHLIRRETYERAPFRAGTPHDDWDFVLRQTNGLGTRLETVPEPLVTHYLHYGRTSLSGASTWRASFAWIGEMRHLMTKRSYSGFCLCVVGPRAASEHDWTAAPYLLWAAFRHGAPTRLQLLTYIAFWIIPPGLRRRLRARLASHSALNLPTTKGPVTTGPDFRN